jgi:hypothetical protein
MHLIYVRDEPALPSCETRIIREAWDDQSRASRHFRPRLCSMFLPVLSTNSRTTLCLNALVRALNFRGIKSVTAFPGSFIRRNGKAQCTYLQTMLGSISIFVGQLPLRLNRAGYRFCSRTMGSMESMGLALGNC